VNMCNIHKSLSQPNISNSLESRQNLNGSGLKFVKYQKLGLIQL
jgi:hypothetical protein